MKNFIDEHEIPCPSCGKHNFTDIRQFNLMFKTFQGVTEDAKNTVYLRPETAQGIFVNFKNVQRTSRKKIPFGIGQIGKSFRNEITPGNFTFRTREFEQMELEFFCKPGTDFRMVHSTGEQFCRRLVTAALASKKMKSRLRDHSPEELVLLQQGNNRYRILIPVRLGRALGYCRQNRLRSDTASEYVSGTGSVLILMTKQNEKYIPYVIEPSLGADRVVSRIPVCCI